MHRVYLHRVYHKNVHVTSKPRKSQWLGQLDFISRYYLPRGNTSAPEAYILLRQWSKVSIISFISMQNGYIALMDRVQLVGRDAHHSATNPAKVNDHFARLPNRLPPFRALRFRLTRNRYHGISTLYLHTVLLLVRPKLRNANLPFIGRWIFENFAEKSAKLGSSRITPDYFVPNGERLYLHRHFARRT